MRKHLTYVAPLQAGKVLGVLYGFLGLVFVPLFLLVALLGNKPGGPPVLIAVFMAIVFPVVYAIGGFIGGIIAAVLYNLVANWTGGFEFEFQDTPPTA
jgi:hypothetical protein